MSHVATVNLQIKDLVALKEACGKLGLEFRQGQETFKWYGRWVNDYSAEDAAYRNGISTEDYGKCLHAIGVKGDENAYEVGVVKNPNGAGYTLVYDNWSGGKGLEAKIGQGCTALKQQYAATVARRQAMKQGFRVREVTRADGSIQLIATK